MHCIPKCALGHHHVKPNLMRPPVQQRDHVGEPVGDAAYALVFADRQCWVRSVYDT
jgi:hypothetical protein